MLSVPRPASLLLVALLATAGLALPSPRADAAPEVSVRQDPHQAEVLALARQVRARQRSLAALNRQADARDRALMGRRAVLATYGWTGDPERVTAVLPLASYTLSAGFGLTGPLWEAEHGGQDFSAPAGEQVVAVAAGTVTDVGDAGPYGLRTVVTLPDGTEVWYCHQTDAEVVAGQAVDVADPIGTVGSTGNTTGPHLHLEVRPDGGAPVDPYDWLVGAGLTP
ncbi:M23 family metallopeptidase [Nocardioides zeicaulis]|uniref:M23 family metallopeptidase n=1 Tax=Nocardioides zeicaulis TaxID=1776857 RepID=A0ABV6E791_9ACTN